jgi:DNA-binding MarR family transcriptional regulator
MPSTTTQPSRLTDVAASLDALLSWVRRHAPTAGYSMTARTTLARLLTDGPARISDLAKVEGVTQPAMTGLINRLESESLVRRDPDPTHARAALVVLTEAGGLLIAERRAERGRLLAAQLERLPDADQQALLAALPALDRLANLPDTS